MAKKIDREKLIRTLKIKIEIFKKARQETATPPTRLYMLGEIYAIEAILEDIEDGTFDTEGK